MKTPVLCLLPFLLVACATPTPSNVGPEAGPTATAPSKRQTEVTQAITAPLNDLNLVRAEIPPPLQQALKAPYGLPQPLNCATITTEVQSLDANLGADLDAWPTDANPSLVERGFDAAGDAAVNALRNTTQGVIPFRSWVRKLTGAERYSKQVAAAIAAGAVRRAYLKGLGQSLSCPAPASPLAAPPPATPASAAVVTPAPDAVGNRARHHVV